jgi:hypothetical protein
VLVWLWARAAFGDDFGIRPWHGALWAIVGLAGLSPMLVRTAWPSADEMAGQSLSVVSLLFAALAGAQALMTWRADLMAGRRRLRVAVLIGSCLYILALAASDFVPGHPEIVGATLLFNLLYQFWLHTELVPKLGPLEWILNTPSHHRVHHASNGAYLDRNYGGVLIIFDRLFGTFVEERDDLPCCYGLVKPLKSYNPLTIALHEWIAMARDVWTARSWRDRLLHVVGPPGWSPRQRDAGAEPIASPLPGPTAP